MSLFVLGTCPGVESLGHMISVWWTNLFLERLYLFAFWPAMRERSSLSSSEHSVTAGWGFQLRLSSHCLRRVRVSIFSCAYLSFVYLFYWSVYSNLCAFLIVFFNFPIIDFREFITYILDIISLSDIWFINISSKPVVSFFIILTESFEKQNFNLLIKSNLSFFF